MFCSCALRVASRKALLLKGAHDEHCRSLNLYGMHLNCFEHSSRHGCSVPQARLPDMVAQRSIGPGRASSATANPNHDIRPLGKETGSNWPCGHEPESSASMRSHPAKRSYNDQNTMRATTRLCPFFFLGLLQATQYALRARHSREGRRYQKLPTAAGSVQLRETHTDAGRSASRGVGRDRRDLSAPVLQVLSVVRVGVFFVFFCAKKAF